MPEPIPTNKSAGRRMPAVRRPTPQVPAPARPQQAQLNVRAQRHRQVVQDRRYLDALALGGFCLIAVTVLIPWLIGKYLLRDSLLLSQDPNVFDVSVRDGGRYFLSDYLSGLLLPGVIVAAFLLLRPWPHRTGFAVIGLGLVVSLLITLSMASGLWAANENQSAETLRVGKFPYQEKFASPCFNGRDFSVVINGQTVSVGVRVVAEDSQPPAFIDYCNLISVYRGWRQISQFLLAGASWAESAFFYSGPENAQFAVLVHPSPETSSLVGFSLDAPDVRRERRVVRRWESGETETGPQPWLWPKLARCLQVSVDELEELLSEGTSGA